MFGMFGTRRITLESQIETLAEFGITLREGVTLNHIFATCPRARMENEPFLRLLIVYAGAGEIVPFGPLSDAVTYVDPMTIFGSGDYSRIVSRFAAIMNADSPVRRPRDYVDLRSRTAWLEFEADGQTLHWPAAVDGHRADFAMIGRVASFLQEHMTERRFVRLPLAGDRSLVMAVQPLQLEPLRKATKLEFEWLTAETPFPAAAWSDNVVPLRQ
jgi:hypothetical protein